jgi:iron complex transport system ATP-binding protein
MFKLSDITRTHGTRVVLDIDQLTLGGEGVTAILGHNGSGKSTLMSILARQDQPNSGSIAFNGTLLNELSQLFLAQSIAYLPQKLPPVAGLTVRELVRLGRFPWRGAFGRWRTDDHAAVDRAMALTNCTDLAERLADLTSGGERQRAWIAMLLAQDAPVLLLDEPTAALDLAHGYEVMRLLRDLAQAAGKRVIVIVHDINLAARFCDHIVALKDGKIAFSGSPKDLLNTQILNSLYNIDMALLPVGPAHLPHAIVKPETPHD